MPETKTQETAFSELPLSKPIMRALTDIGYEIPTPIQAQIIPHVASGADVIGQAQTGTGKTAAFALPLLSNIDLKNLKKPQVLVLTPTRELAIQVAEAFQKYASHMKDFHVLPIYGGQEYSIQLRKLKRGVHVVVGTPGRVMDHIRRESLKVDELKCLVLDEADEMLRMGFIDDVKWVLEQTPNDRQVALFSATLSPEIRKIAKRYLNSPTEITIKSKTSTLTTTRQRYWTVNGLHKMDALTRILEVEPFDAVLVFVRTKVATVDISEKLEARGYASAPLNGDIAQRQRERTIENLKKGKFNILVATDVAARGLDVSRISHVINYDIPYDTEAYIHRIGRTGRAGKTGEAILFVSSRERNMLYSIEKATKQKIELMKMPSKQMVNENRILNFKQRITNTLHTEDLDLYTEIVTKYQEESNLPLLEIAATLAKLAQGNEPLLLKDTGKDIVIEKFENTTKDRGRRDNKRVRNSKLRPGMERFRLEVGENHKVKPGNIVGAIINEAGIESEFICNVDIKDDYSFVDLPEGMSRTLLNKIKRIRVVGKQLNISKLDSPKKKSYVQKKKINKTYKKKD